MVETARVVGALAAASIRSFSSSTRMNVLRALGSALLVASEAGGVAILLHRFDGIGGWTVAEVLLIHGIAQTGLGLAMLAAEPLEPPEFSQLIREGRLDHALTRPLPPLLWVVATDVQVRNVGRVVAGASVAGGALVAVDVAVGPADLALVALAVVAMAITVGAVLVVGAAITMWTIEGTEVVNAFTYGGAVLAGWPLQIYSGALRFVFVWVVPVGLAVFVPALWILDRDGPPGAGRELLLFVPVGVGLTCGIATVAWRAGLARYRGAGG